MKALSIARKTLVEYLREPLLIGLLFGFPIMLLGLYDVAFGATEEEGLASYLSVLVLNQDTGPLGENLVGAIRASRFQDQPVFDVTQVAHRRPAEIALRERKASLLVVIPPDLSQSLTAATAADPAATPATLALVGDPNSDTFVFARSMLDAVIQEFVDQTLDLPKRTWTVSYEFVPGTGTMSDFEFGVPGMIVFGIMFVTISTAMTLVRETVSGTLRRLRLTRISAFDLLLGVTLAQMALAVILVLLTFGAATLMGFHGKGSLWLAMGVSLLLSLAAVGLGLITACFARNDGEAANLAAVAAVLMVIVSGAMYPMPEIPLATVAGRPIQVYDLLPPTHAAEALRQVLIFGEGLPAIVYQLIAMALLSLIFLAAGVALFQRLRMRAG